MKTLERVASVSGLHTWMMKSDESSDSEQQAFKIYEEGKLKETLICHKFTLNYL